MIQWLKRLFRYNNAVLCYGPYNARYYVYKEHIQAFSIYLDDRKCKYVLKFALPVGEFVCFEDFESEEDALYFINNNFKRRKPQ